MCRSKISCHVLALNGEKDIQVNSQKNLTAIKNALNQTKGQKIEIKEIPQLNHLFQHCKKCTFKEYDEIEETFAPLVLEIVGNWILGIIN